MTSRLEQEKSVILSQLTEQKSELRSAIKDLRREILEQIPNNLPTIPTREHSAKLQRDSRDVTAEPRDRLAIGLERIDSEFQLENLSHPELIANAIKGLSGRQQISSGKKPIEKAQTPDNDENSILHLLEEKPKSQEHKRLQPTKELFEEETPGLTALDDTQEIIMKASKAYRIVEAKQKRIKNIITESNNERLAAHMQ